MENAENISENIFTMKEFILQTRILFRGGFLLHHFEVRNVALYFQ